jgi:uncharacterized protein (UPF0332 family)
MPASNEQTDKAQQLLNDAADLLENGRHDEAQTTALIALGYSLIGSARIYFDAAARDE